MNGAAKTREALVGDGCLSVKEAAKQSGFSTWVLYEAIKVRALPYVEVGRRKVIPRKALREFLADRLVLE